MHKLYEYGCFELVITLESAVQFVVLGFETISSTTMFSTQFQPVVELLSSN
jgi:hypothetical protein